VSIPGGARIIASKPLLGDSTVSKRHFRSLEPGNV